MATSLLPPAPLPVDGGSSAQGLLALLEEENPALKGHALQQLYHVVDQYWAEVANEVPLIEELSEDPTFEHRHLAAAVASRCFFHLEEYNDALRLALGAGRYFDVAASSSSRTAAENQFVDTLVAKCIDEYTALRGREAEGEEVEIDPRMVGIVERVFDRCFADGAWTHAMGIALEARLMDKVREILDRAAAGPEKRALLAYALESCVGSHQVVGSRDFRLRVLRGLAEVHASLPPEDRDYAAEILCLQHVADSQAAAEALQRLLEGPETAELLAYQIAFDIAESEDQPFILGLLGHLEAGTAPAEGDAAAADPAPAEGTAAAADPAPAASAPASPSPKVAKLLRVLRASGFTVDVQVNFLHGQSKADSLLLASLKDAVDARNSTLHQATVAAHGFMYAGCASKSFVAQHMDWFGRAANWAKFSATASLGVIYRPKGTLQQSKDVLEEYLPTPGSTSPSSEGGALLALGIIHAAKAGDSKAAAAENAVVPFILDALNAAGPNEHLQHGACIALGLAAMGTADPSIFNQLKNVLFNDTAIGGEAAAYGIGLLLLGRGGSSGADDGWVGSALPELLAYAHDTQHEKIIRALSLAMALASYGREEGADSLIETLSRDRDAIVRYGAMYTIGLAYVGTGANAAVRRLLHVAVSDVSDDVRRAAVMNLGFVLFRQPDRLPPLVALLTESYNPHVRYGAAVALGIALAGSANSDAGTASLKLLEHMHDDAVDFVRQGSLVASAMILIQQPDVHPAVKPFREKISGLVREKHMSTMTKMGAIIAHGVLDAGGRNVTISLSSRAGFTKASAVVGLVLWTQHWYWYPMQHMLGLAFSPTALVGLNKDFNMPNSFSAVCAAKPSLFAYPKMTETKKEDKKERVATVTLSTTARAKARELRKEKSTLASERSEDAKADKPSEAKTSDMEVEGEDAGAGEAGEAADAEAKAAKKKEPEPSSFRLANPSRVTPEQVKFVSWDLQQRYVPVNPRSKPSGLVMLVDREPEEPEEVSQVKVPSGDEDENEAEPPEPFEWSPPV